jgi:hypothetical protein
MNLKTLAVLTALVGLGAVAARADSVVVSTNATTITSGNSSRRHLYIQNLGPNNITIGTTAVLSGATTGYLLKSSDTLNMQEFSGSLYGTAATGTSDVRVLKQTR